MEDILQASQTVRAQLAGAWQCISSDGRTLFVSQDRKPGAVKRFLMRHFFGWEWNDYVYHPKSELMAQSLQKVVDSCQGKEVRELSEEQRMALAVSAGAEYSMNITNNADSFDITLKNTVDFTKEGGYFFVREIRYMKAGRFRKFLL